MSILVAELKNRLREALSSRDIRPFELSSKTGIPKSSISQYMSGHVKPNGERIYLIAKALDVDEAWLMGHDVPKEKHTNKITDMNFSSDEANLITVYRKLSDTGKEKVTDYTNMVYSSEQAKK